MGLEATWTLVDIPPTARDAAQAAAHREGVTVGEWLTRRILRRFSELNLREQEEAFTELRAHVAGLAERLERSESDSRSEAMREAVKKLHEGLTRLTDDLVQTTGHSSIQISTLSAALDGVNGKVDEIRSQASQAGGSFDRRVAHVQQTLESLDHRYKEAARILATKTESLSEAMNELRGEIPRRWNHIEQDVALMQTGLEDLDARQSEAIGSQNRKLESLDQKIDAICTSASEASSAFDQRITRLQQNFAIFETRDRDQSRLIARTLENLDSSINEARTEASDMCGALDHRLLLVQQNLQTVDNRHAEVTQTLARNVESLAAHLGEAKSQTSAASTALEHRVAQISHAVEELDSRHIKVTDTAARNVELLAAHLNEIRSKTSAASVALEQRMAQIGHAVEKLDSRHIEVTDSAARNVESLAGHLNEIRSETSAASAALEQRVAQIGRAVEKLDSRHIEATDSAARNVESLAAHLNQIRSETSAASAALEQRVAQIGQTVEKLDSRQTEVTDTAVRNAESLAAHLNEIRAETSAASAALEQRMAQLGQVVQALDAQSRIGADAQAEAARQNATASAAVLKLEKSVGDLSTQFAALPTNERALALEHELSDVASRLGAAEEWLAALEPRTGAFDASLKDLDARFEAGIDKQQNELAALQSHLLQDALQAVDAKLETAGHQLELAFSELKSSLFEELSAALANRAGEQPNRNVLQSAEATIPAASVAVHDADLVPDHLTTDVHDESAVAERHAFHPAPTETAPHHDDGRIIELTVPADSHEPESAHPGVLVEEPPPDSATSPPPFPETLAVPVPGLALAAAGGVGVVPAMGALMRDEQGESPSHPSSYLSAARQSLKAAAAQSESETGKKEFFPFRFFRPRTPQKKSQTTSYALLAGIALVAILAIVMAAGELLSRSEAPANATFQRAAVGAKSLTQRHALAAPASAKKPAAVQPVPGQTIKTSNGAPGAVKPSAPSATNRLASLANAGDAQAQLLLGLQALASANNPDAVKWLDSAARQGVVVAQYRMGTLYAAGRGVPADPAKAFHWYEAAAQSGNRKAMSNLAVAYAQGAGTEKNSQEAARWFLKAAQLGLVDAQFDLAVLYERGFGVPQSLPEAYRWYLIAAHAGDQESKDRVEALASQLSAKDRAQAETSAAQFKPLPMDTQANEPQ